MALNHDQENLHKGYSYTIPGTHQELHCETLYELECEMNHHGDFFLED